MLKCEKCCSNLLGWKKQARFNVCKNNENSYIRCVTEEFQHVQLYKTDKESGAGLCCYIPHIVFWIHIGYLLQDEELHVVWGTIPIGSVSVLFLCFTYF